MHGGDIYHRKITYDFSVNINPLGLPEGVKMALQRGLELVGHYPDLTCDDLRAAIGEKYNLDPDFVVCGNGASELIQAICLGLSVREAVVIPPYFTGYAAALDAVNAKPIPLDRDKLFRRNLMGKEIFEPDKVLPEEFQLCFLTNPNNPDGFLWTKDQVIEMAKACSKRNAVLLVDECFMDLTGKAKEYSLAREVQKYSNVIVLSAFTKSMAIPGVRIGYCLCPTLWAAKDIKRVLPEWNVSILAQEAGKAAVKEDAYLEKSIEFIAKERAFLQSELTRLGYKCFPSEANYFLIYSADHKDLKERLLEKEILIRDCRDYAGLGEGYYRIAVRPHQENLILIKALEDLT